MICAKATVDIESERKASGPKWKPGACTGVRQSFRECFETSVFACMCIPECEFSQSTGQYCAGVSNGCQNARQRLRAGTPRLKTSVLLRMLCAYMCLSLLEQKCLTKNGENDTWTQKQIANEEE